MRGQTEDILADCASIEVNERRRSLERCGKLEDIAELSQQATRMFASEEAAGQTVQIDGHDSSSCVC